MPALSALLSRPRSFCVTELWYLFSLEHQSSCHDLSWAHRLLSGLPVPLLECSGNLLEEQIEQSSEILVLWSQKRDREWAAAKGVTRPSVQQLCIREVSTFRVSPSVWERWWDVEPFPIPWQRPGMWMMAQRSGQGAAAAGRRALSETKRAQLRANEVLLRAKCSLTELWNHLARDITVVWVNMSSGESCSSSGRRKQPEMRLCRDTIVCLHSLLGEARRQFGFRLAVLTFLRPSSCLELLRAFSGHAGVSPSPARPQCPRKAGGHQVPPEGSQAEQPKCCS